MMVVSSPSDDSGDALRALLESGRFREALAWHHAAPEAVRQRGEVQLYAATAATRLGDLGLASALAATALEQFRVRADLDGRMRAANLLGAIHFERGHIAEAEEWFGSALLAAQELHDSLMAARASNNLASVAHLQGRSEVALSLYRTALLNYQRLGDRRGMAETYHNLGLTFRFRSAWSDADRASAEAVRHAELCGEGTLRALARTGRAELHLERGDTEHAGEELAQATRLARAAGDLIGEAEAGRILALAALRTGRAEAALQQAETAEAGARERGSVLLAAECASVAALALRALGRPEADARRAEALAELEGLGARALLDRFEQAWGAPPR